MSGMLVFGIATGIIVALGVWCFTRVRAEYGRKETLSTPSVVGVWVLYVFHLVTTVAASTNGVWYIPLPAIVSRGTGILLLVIGAVLLVLGIWAFHSFQRMSGMDTSSLVTSGIYRWSRNPQNLGWALCLLGIAILGQSGLAFMLTVLFWVLFENYVRLEEQYLESIFGEDYRNYLRWSHRYFGPPEKFSTPA